MIPTAITRLETDLVTQAIDQVGRRLSSAELGNLVLHMVGERARDGEATRMLPLLLRLAIKLTPYASFVQKLMTDHGIMMRAWARRALPQLIETIDACRVLKVPVPVIVSREPSLFKARCAQMELRARYFGLTPIIVHGNASALQERLIDSELCLPVDDGFGSEAIKVLEMMVLLDALGADCGVLKMDEDLLVLPKAPLSLPAIQTMFARADYLGLALTSADLDRCGHYDRCDDFVPIAYGKPSAGPWARGTLYYLSGSALKAAARHYLRYPGCLEGECFEDKAVGDILRDNGIALTNQPLEPRLGVSQASVADDLMSAAA